MLHWDHRGRGFDRLHVLVSDAAGDGPGLGDAPMDNDDVDFPAVFLEVGIIWLGIHDVLVNFGAPGQCLTANRLSEAVFPCDIDIVENGDGFSELKR